MVSPRKGLYCISNSKHSVSFIIEVNKYLIKRERKKRRKGLIRAASPFLAEPIEKAAFSYTEEK